MSWKNGPIQIDKLENSDEIDWFLYLDESGSHEMKTIHRILSKGKTVTTDDINFTLTGVLMPRSKQQFIIRQFDKLKNKYWQGGTYYYKNKQQKEKRKVCLHSYDIRKRKGPFNRDVLTQYDDFVHDLSVLMESLDVKVFSVTIDKEACYNLNSDVGTYDVYGVATSLLLESVSKLVAREGVIVIAESRGKRKINCYWILLSNWSIIMNYEAEVLNL